MRKVTRFFSLLLAIAMVLAMNLGTLTVSADDTYKITIKNASEGHTYTAYQIFTGDVSDTTLSNVKWGDDVNSNDVISALISAKIIADTTYNSAQEVAEALAGTDAAEIATAIVDSTGALKSGSGTAATANGTSVDIENLVSGYYLVTDTVDSGTPAEEGDVYSAYIVEVVGANVEANTKQDIPTVDKKVKDTNDSTGEATDWQDSADADVNDEISYQLKATLGSTAGYLSYYTEYNLTFTDTLSAGLTCCDTDKVVVKIDGKTIDSTCYTVNLSNYTGQDSTYTNGHVLTVEIDVLDDDLKDSSGDPVTVDSNSVITVEYTATLNSNAAIGSTGNPNEVVLSYSNNPNEPTAEGKTTKDKVTVFTFELDVNKVIGGTGPSYTALTGAGFTLYKFYKATGGSDKVSITDNNDVQDVEGNWTVVDTIAAGSASTFTFEKLDDGYYKIVEDTTPSGYNSIAPIYFIVTSGHDPSSNEPQLTTLDATVYTATGDDNDVTLTVSTDKYTADASSGVISATVENYSGAVMPETGGMGTKIFYTLGGILVVGAGILLIVKRRMKNA